LRKSALALALSLAALAVAVPVATSQSGAALRRESGNVVKLTALKAGLAFDKKTVTAKAGKVTIVFTNLSPLPHNVVLEQGEKPFGGTKTIATGKTTAVLTLKKGEYRFYCNVPGHEDAGMSGKLIVS